MALINVSASALAGKDSRWLQLEVCREFQRNKCTRTDGECKFAHPPASVEVQNGKVTACYDSIKGRCNRDKPPCKYFHPPQHLKEQLLVNGRQQLLIRNHMIQAAQVYSHANQLHQQTTTAIMPSQTMQAAVDITGRLQVFGSTNVAAAAALTIAQQPLALMGAPYLTAQGMPAVSAPYNQYFSSQMMPAILGPADPNNPLSLATVQQTAVLTQQKVPARTDRVEQGYPAMVPTFKRTATGDKSGVPVYQQQHQHSTTTTYLQPTAASFVPMSVSCEYRPTAVSTTAAAAAAAFTGVSLNKQPATAPNANLTMPASVYARLQSAQNAWNQQFFTAAALRSPQLAPFTGLATATFADLLAAQYSVANANQTFLTNAAITPIPTAVSSSSLVANNNNNNNNNNNEDEIPVKKLKTN